MFRSRSRLHEWRGSSTLNPGSNARLLSGGEVLVSRRRCCVGSPVAVPRGAPVGGRVVEAGFVVAVVVIAIAAVVTPAEGVPFVAIPEAAVVAAAHMAMVGRESA